MTWGEFKSWVEAQGVRNQDTIGYIDTEREPVHCEQRDGEWQIT
jgi:hypothetical protein